MTSEDVLHDFFVPDMRVKHDIIPGRYTEVWFTPTVLGLHNVTCAEYCGKGHSDMQAKLIVENQADFDKFIETGGTEWEDYKTNPADWGKIQWERKGCYTLPYHRRHAQRQGARVGRASGAKWKR